MLSTPEQDSVDNGEELPVVVDDRENIARALKLSVHFDARKNVLKHNCFRPKAGGAIVSVIRSVIGENACKSHGLRICGSDFLGFAVLSAAEIRKQDAEVSNAPDDFFGHAHIEHGTPSPVIVEHEPLDPELNEKMVARCKALLKASRFLRDLRPDLPEWVGEEFAA